MVIRLIADDPELQKLCRDILAETPELARLWSLVSTPAGAEWSDADLHIWDFRPDLPLPESGAWNPLRHLFLVGREELERFQERTGLGEGNVLLKPVGRATLTAFLVAAVLSGAIRSLRADRDEILQCFIQTNLKLQEYDHERTAFLARAVHDFRAPLTALNGYCGLLLTEPLGQLNENQNEVLRRMQDSARRLSRMLSAMYELSVERRVRRQPDLKLADLRECLQQALGEMAQFAGEKSISITVDLAPGADSLYLEPGLIEQLLINILDNACRFTPRAGLIDIRGYPFFWDRRNGRSAPPAAGRQERRRQAVRDPNSYRVDISDSGAPIPEDRLQVVFEEHTSFAGAGDRSGGGLGLAICRMILQQHHGRIWAENRDSGPVFSFVLPLRPFNSAATPSPEAGASRDDRRGIAHVS